MDKPKPKTIEAHDYHECEQHIESLCGRDIRDYAGHFKDDSQPYQDFWHWIIKTRDIHNGSYFYLSRDEIEYYGDDMPDFVKEIINMFCDEFGEEILFYVWW